MTSFLFRTVYCLLGILVATKPGLPEEGVDRAFYMAADPALSVLEVREVGGSTGQRTVTALYGDCRLVRERRHRDGQVFDLDEKVLSIQDCRRLVQTAVDHRLAEFDKDRFNAQIEQRFGKGRLPIVDDAGSIKLNIQLEDYVVEGVSRGPVKKSVSIPGLSVFGRVENPPVLEASGIQELRKAMRQLLDGGGWPYQVSSGHG